MGTLVCFHAHPDDESIATGGVMAKAARDGHRVVLVLATKGEQGEPKPGVLADGEELGDRRTIESQRSAEILGAGRVEFLGYRDSGMMGEPTNDDERCFWQADVNEAAECLAAILRDEQADVLTIYDDHGGYGHPDHVQVHRVGLAAAERAGVARVFEATMNRNAIKEMMAQDTEAMEAMEADERPSDDEFDTFGTPEEDITHCVDVSEFIDRKRLSMEAHASQISEDTFFLAMPKESFARAFGLEWFIAHGESRDGEPMSTDLFE